MKLVPLEAVHVQVPVQVQVHKKSHIVEDSGKTKVANAHNATSTPASSTVSTVSETTATATAAVPDRQGLEVIGSELDGAPQGKR